MNIDFTNNIIQMKEHDVLHKPFPSPEGFSIFEKTEEGKEAAPATDGDNDKKEAKIQQALLTEKLWEKDELISIGESVYQKNCVACHQVSGEGLLPIFPALVGSEIVLNDKERQIEILMEGVQGAAMASYAEQLTEVEIAAVITYTRQAWGNDETGDGKIVIPKEILDYKNNKL